MTAASAAFLRQQGWLPEQAVPFPADWSARRYARLTRPQPPDPRAASQAILMETAPDADFHAFIRIAGLLRGLGIAAPEIYAADTAQGFMLLEDFGDRNLGRLFDGGADPLPYLLQAQTLLCQIQRRSLTLSAAGLPHFDSARFIALLDPLLENFPYANAERARRELQDVWRKTLAPLAAQPHALLLRDFMPDNLMALTGRPNGTTLGVLDFELAGIGPLAYDLASLTEQVRRDLPDEVRQAVYEAYLAEWPELEPRGFLASVRLLAVQRHARTFARLKQRQQPDFYIRTFAFLQRQLQHPDCTAVRGWFVTHLPQYFA